MRTYESEFQRNNVALLPDILLSVRKQNLATANSRSCNATSIVEAVVQNWTLKRATEVSSLWLSLSIVSSKKTEGTFKKRRDITAQNV
jgi:hypothetical protein